MTRCRASETTSVIGKLHVIRGRDGLVGVKVKDGAPYVLAFQDGTVCQHFADSLKDPSRIHAMPCDGPRMHVILFDTDDDDSWKLVPETVDRKTFEGLPWTANIGTCIVSDVAGPFMKGRVNAPDAFWEQYADTLNGQID